VHQHCAQPNTVPKTVQPTRSHLSGNVGEIRRARARVGGLTAGFRRGVYEIFPLPGSYTAYIYSWLSTFWDNLSVPFSNVKQQFKYRTVYTETSTTNCQSTLPNIPKENIRIRRMALLYNRGSY